MRQRARQGALLREGIKVVIAGQPNAGKSSLLNALAGAELAIVTPIAGTTRDVVSQTIQIEGVPLHVVDTAGLRDSDDEVERIGIERAWGQIDGADAVLFLHDLTRAATPTTTRPMPTSRAAAQRSCRAGVPVLDVWNKLDAAPAPCRRRPTAHRAVGQDRRTASRRCASALLEVAGWQAAPEGVYIARARHVQALRRVDGAPAQARGACCAAARQALDLLAEELRLAQNALSEITGEFSADDLLGVIFSRFCIGK